VEWIVDAASPRSLAAVLAALGDLADGALAEGRVLVCGVRESDGTRQLALGDRVVISPPRAFNGDVEVLAESAGFVFVAKPPELPTEPDKSGNASVRALLATLLGVPESRLHAVSRLDVGVSGVVTFARTAEARRRAASLQESNELSKSYVGITVGAPRLELDAIGSFRDPVDGRPAETRWRLVARAGQVAVPAGAPARPAMFALSPVTGRKHQIRVHCAAAQMPLLGDRAYAGPHRLVLPDGAVVEAPRVALHAARVVLPRAGREPLVVAAAVPEDLVQLWRVLGGDDAAWQRAVGSAGIAGAS